MKYLTEFRDGELASKLAREIRYVVTRPWTIMEVCGGPHRSSVTVPSGYRPADW